MANYLQDTRKVTTHRLTEMKQRGEKIAIIGPNGIGKSTLFKIILGDISPFKGKTSLGVNVNPGYYDQEHHELDDRNSIFDEIHNAYPNMTNGEIRNVLAAFVVGFIVGL